MKRTLTTGEPPTLPKPDGGEGMGTVVVGHHAKKSAGVSRFGLDELLTVPEVAELLRFTVKGIYPLVEARRIPFVRISNRLRFCQTDVLAWLRENRVPSVERNR